MKPLLDMKKPSTIDDIIEIISYSNENKIPIYTSDSIGSGVYLDRSDMNKIRKIDEKNMFANIEWGVTFEQLKQVLDSKNLTIQYPISSTSDSILSSFSNLNVILGNTRHKVRQIANLQVILPNKRIYNTGASSLSKDNIWREDGGPNLNRIFLGSNEIFGIIVSGTIFLYPKIEKILVGFEFKELQELLSVTKNIVRLEHGEDVLILNKNSMKRRFGEEISKDWCLLISFNKKYYEIERNHYLKKLEIEKNIINKSLDSLNIYLERNWRDFENLEKLSFYALFQNSTKLHNIIKNYLDSFICEVVPIEYGRSIYFQYFFEKDVTIKAKLIKELMKTNLCVLTEINKDTIEILKRNSSYFKTAKDIKNLLDKNNILNPQSYFGGK